MRQKRELTHEYMQFVTDDLIRFALAMIDAGADVIAMSDPSGTGEILGPKFFDEYAVTYINQVVDAVQAKGARIIVHLCGQMKAVYEKVAKIHSDAINDFEVIEGHGHNMHQLGHTAMDIFVRGVLSEEGLALYNEKA